MTFRVQDNWKRDLELEGEVSFRCRKDAGLLAVAFLLISLTIGIFHTLNGDSSSQYAIVALIFFALISLISGGMEVEIVFKPRVARMVMIWRCLSIRVLSRSFPYGELFINLRKFGMVSPSGRIYFTDSLGYSLDVGKSHHLIKFPQDVPLSEEQLFIIRSDLGFFEKML